MDVAIVAPCPVPYMRGGAENLWSGLQEHLNESTAHQAEVLKLPSREHSLWDLVDSYRSFSALDLSGFDVVLSGKYPAWMVSHPRHVVYMLHRLRGLYDTYHYFGLPETVEHGDPDVRALLDHMAATSGQREGLSEFFDRMSSLRAREASLPVELFAFPGPLARTVVHWLDGVGMAPVAISRYGAISNTVRTRDDGAYFPPGVDVFVVLPPSQLPVPARSRWPGERRRPYVFTVSRLDGPKRVELLIEAMAHVRTKRARLVIAGTGPQEARLRQLAAPDDRISFCGRVTDEELQRLYRGARGVAFVPHDEDFGLVALEAMRAGKPVISCHDSGGPGELVVDGVTGYVTDPDPEALGAAINRLWSSKGERRRMGSEGCTRALAVTWDPLVRELEALA